MCCNPLTIKKMLEMMDQAPSLVSLACSFLGDTFSINDKVIDTFLLNHGLNILNKYLSPQNSHSLNYDIVFAISNIAAGSPDQINQIISHGEILPKIFSLFWFYQNPSEEYKQIKKTLLLVFVNMIYSIEDNNLLM